MYFNKRTCILLRESTPSPKHQDINVRETRWLACRTRGRVGFREWRAECTNYCLQKASLYIDIRHGKYERIVLGWHGAPSAILGGIRRVLRPARQSARPLLLKKCVSVLEGEGVRAGDR